MHGREELPRVPERPDSSCKTVVFPPYRVYPDKQVHVQITLNHMSLDDSVTVHHVVTLWTENVNVHNFTVCALQTGRNEPNFNPFATFDWIAYQGAPPHGLTGMILIQEWWSGTNCEAVYFPKVGLHSPNVRNSCHLHVAASNMFFKSAHLFYFIFSSMI